MSNAPEISNETEKMPEIKPCPFCGGEGYVNRTLRDGCKSDEIEAFAYTVCCKCCAAEGGWRKTQSGGIREWNNRIPSRAQVAREIVILAQNRSIVGLLTIQDLRDALKEWEEADKCQ